MLLVVSDTTVIIFNGFIWVPAAILGWLINSTSSKINNGLTSGDEILTFRMLVSMISSLSQTVSSRNEYQWLRKVADAIVTHQA